MERLTNRKVCTENLKSQLQQNIIKTEMLNGIPVLFFCIHIVYHGGYDVQFLGTEGE